VDKRRQTLPAAERRREPSQQDREHLEELLDGALEQTFPASDPVAMLEPAPDFPQEARNDPVPFKKERNAMPLWVVKATWIEDESEASERWEVSAATAHDAVREVTARLRFQPHHVDARRLTEAEAVAAAARSVGGAPRRIPPQ
jgi:hypothetical protein